MPRFLFLARASECLDEAGWKQLSKLLKDTLASAMKIGEESASRLASDGADGISSSLSLLHFELPAKEAK